MGTNQIKDHIIGICCYSTKHASLRSKSKGLLARNLDNGPEWRVMTICESVLSTNHFNSHSYARSSGSEIYYCFFLFHKLLRNIKIYMYTKANVFHRTD